MSIAQKVRSVERLFGHLDVQIAAFQAQSGLHCLAGCGHCCTKPDIDATPLEFLPYAFDLFLKGQAEEMLEKLRAESSPICQLYAPLSLHDKESGSCGSYRYRALVCRLFGFGATRDKYGQLRLATCKLIKSSQADTYAQTMEDIRNGLEVPIFSDFFKRLYQIDMRLGSTFMPINDAMKEAIEVVLHHYAYRPFPKKLRRVA
jgi:Fe-S-cluster containining protein